MVANASGSRQSTGSRTTKINRSPEAGAQKIGSRFSEGEIGARRREKYEERTGGIEKRDGEVKTAQKNKMTSPERRRAKMKSEGRKRVKTRKREESGKMEKEPRTDR